MDIESLLLENQILKAKNEELIKELDETKEHLKKYTAPSYKKIYYENNKEEINQKHKEYNKKYTPTEEQKKKWARTAYLNRKAKLQKESQNI
jgi:hypothetical protein